MNSLIVGFGSDLRGDDGVGVAVVRRLAAGPLPEGVRCAEIGIGGIALVHELLAGCDRLVIVDAVRRGGAPGTVYVLAPVVPDLARLTAPERHDFLVEAHFADPYRALVLGRALGVLPVEVHVVGVDAAETDELSLELTPAVARAVPVAAERALRLASEGLARDLRSLATDGIGTAGQSPSPAPRSLSKGAS